MIGDELALGHGVGRRVAARYPRMGLDCVSQRNGPGTTFGPQATRIFQQRAGIKTGIKVDGVVGPQLRSKMAELRNQR